MLIFPRKLLARELVLGVIALSLFSSAASARQYRNLIRNPGFESGLAHWGSRPGEPPCARIESAPGAPHSGRSCVRVKAIGHCCGIQTENLYPGLDFFLDADYVLSVFVKNLGVKRGEFGIRFYCCDADGQCIVMKSFASTTAATPVQGWQQHVFRFGPGREFNVPSETDHIFVRASFYRKDGDCEGEVLLDDFSLRREGTPQPPRPRGERGNVAVWRHDGGPAPIAAPSKLADALRQARCAVRILTTSDLTDSAVLCPDDFDLLVVPYADIYPAAGKMPLLRFIRGGGNLLVLGPPVFSNLLYPAGNGWVTERDFAVSPPADVPVAFGSEKDLHLNVGSRDARPSLRLVADGDAKTLEMKSRLVAYQYVGVEMPPPPGPSYCLVHFFAKGDENTPYLCLELNEDDDSRWKAVVPLGKSWREYSVHTGRFRSYATEGRGGPGDFFHVERSARLQLGFPASLVGEGERSFQVRGISWRKSKVAEDVVVGDPVCFVDDPLKAFGSPLKRPSRFFLGVADGMMFEGDVPGPSWKSRRPWTPAGTTMLRRGTRRLHRTGMSFQDRRRVMIVPVLSQPEEPPRALVQINKTGVFKNTVLAFYPKPESGETELLSAVVELADFCVNTPLIVGIDPHAFVKNGTVMTSLRVTVSNRSPQAVRDELLVAVADERSGNGREIVLPPKAESSHETPARPVSGFDWRKFGIEVRLRSASSLSDTVDVKAVLREMCDFFTMEQKKRGDGKFSGITYQDSRTARTLLAAYDMFGEKKYLDSAVAWGGAVIAEQRDDGGYRMGYGVYDVGEECYVADGGEIGLGIARVCSYLPPPKRAAYVQSLRKYNDFRESFRCEGGGLGVGYCKRDYGVRPVVPLKEIKKIYAPERNLYTIGCTIGFASAYAALTDDPKAHAAAARDARWLMTRQPDTTHGVFAEGFIWAHRFVKDDALKKEIAAYLGKALVRPLLATERKWWLGAGGREVLSLSALSYYYDNIRSDPAVLAHMIEVTFRLCAVSSDDTMQQILSQPKLTHADWRYLSYGGVSLAEVAEPGITLKPFH